LGFKKEKNPNESMFSVAILLCSKCPFRRLNTWTTFKMLNVLTNCYWEPLKTKTDKIFFSLRQINYFSIFHPYKVISRRETPKTIDIITPKVVDITLKPSSPQSSKAKLAKNKAAYFIQRKYYTIKLTTPI
jgi:hypothetical protein